MRLPPSESIMRRLILTIVASAALLIVGALVPERSGVQTPAAPVSTPADASFV
jgi:hypothetical protein